eukprot:1191734-Prorocentrum_minimum.AAC.1
MIISLRFTGPPVPTTARCMLWCNIPANTNDCAVQGQDGSTNRKLLSRVSISLGSRGDFKTP